MLSALCGCSLPFGILCAVAFGSVLCSFIIGADADHISNVRLGARAPVLNRAFPRVHGIPMALRASTTLSSGLQERATRPEASFCGDYLLCPDTGCGFDSSDRDSSSRLFTHPPVTVETLRKQFGTRRSVWGDWSAHETREFYKSQLPTALQADGAMNLSLAERAHLASANRHALRLYARERCLLPIRAIAVLYDGLRHLYCFGTWCASGMTWAEVLGKYRKEAVAHLGEGVSEQEIATFVYNRIVERACSTNAFFDHWADHGLLATMLDRIGRILSGHRGNSSSNSSSEAVTDASSSSAGTRSSGNLLKETGQRVVLMLLSSTLLRATGVIS